MDKRNGKGFSKTKTDEIKKVGNQKQQEDRR